MQQCGMSLMLLLLLLLSSARLNFYCKRLAVGRPLCVIRDRASDRRLNAAEISGLTATARVVSIVMLRAGSCEKYCRYRYIAVT